MLLVSYSNFTHHFISCDTLPDPLRHHAADFKCLVDIRTLPNLLYQNNLLDLRDMQYLQLSTVTESDKVDYLYLKMVRLGEEEYEKLLSCLEDPHAKEHPGHTKLHDILTKPQ